MTALLSIHSVDKAPQDPAALTGVSVERPWRGMPIVDGRLEIDGQIRTPHACTALEVLIDGRAVATLPLQDRRAAAQRDTNDTPEEHTFGFGGAVTIGNISPGARITFSARLATGGALVVATLQVQAVSWDDAQLAMLRPDFIIAGTMKSGTTGLYDFLCKHQGVIPRLPKELHFFNEHYDRGLDLYRSYFVPKLDAANAGRLIGEATPGYVSPYEPECAARVRAFAPAARIIVALRDPAQRAISHYHHKQRTLGLEKRTLEDAFSEERVHGTAGGSHDYLAHGHYLDNLQPWFAAFPPEQLLVLNFHDLETRPDDLLERLFAFVGLPRDPSIKVRKVYANEYDAPSQEIMERLRRYYVEPNRRLAEALGKGFAFDAG